MPVDSIERLALGNPMSIGYLYNACTEQPCNMSIFKEYPPPAGSVIITDTPNTNSYVLRAKSMSDKLSKLEVAAELKLSLCAGLISVKGSAEYLKETMDSERTASVSVVHKITTKHENLRILDSNFRDQINHDALKQKGATHVVTGISWGANLIVTAEDRNSENKDQDKLEGKVEVVMKKFSINIEGSAKLGAQNIDAKEKSNFTLKIVGDVLAPGEYPTSFEDVLKLMAKLPSLLQTYNNGKGVPISYHMISLEAVRRYFDFQVELDSSLRLLPEDMVLRMVMLFDGVEGAKQKLNDLCADVDRYEEYLPDTLRWSVKQLRTDAAVAASKFQTKLKTLLVQVRAGDAEESVLDALRQEYESSPDASAAVLRKLQQDLRAIQGKIQLVSNLKSLNVSIVEKNTQSLSNKFVEFKAEKVYVLFGESDAIMYKNKRQWEEHFITFRYLINESQASSSNVSFLYVDLDAAPHLQPEELDGEMRKILLQRFDENGQRVESDVYKTLWNA